MLIETIVFWVETKMEVKFYIALLILGLISTALAKGGHKRHHDDDDHHKKRGDYKCSPPVISDDLPLTCTVTDHCGTYMCSAEFDGEKVTLSLKFYRSHDPLSAEITLKVPGRDFEWSHTFKSGDKIQVEGFPLTIKGIMSADMYLLLTMDKHWKGISFELDLVLSSNLENMDLPLLKGKMPMKYDDDDDDGREYHHKGRCSRFASWFKRQPASVKAAVVISAILVFSLLITGLVYCCKKRRAPVADVVKVKPPSYDEATTTKTKVPLEPLVNEED